MTTKKTTKATKDKSTPDAAQNGANQATAPANGISHTGEQPQYTPVPRTAEEWQDLADKVKERTDAMRARGNLKGAEEYEFTHLRPLLNNIELARKADNGVHADAWYDNSQTILKLMRRGYGSRKVGRDTTQAEHSIMIPSGADPLKTSDTTGSGAEVSTPLPAPVADNTGTTSTVTTNSTVGDPVRTIEKESTNEKFTKFRVGDLLRIPAHYRKEGYPVAAIKVERNTIRYGFAVASWDSKLLHWYSEDVLAALNPHKVKPAPEQPVQEAKPEPKHARLSPVTQKAWLGMIVAGMDAIREGHIAEGKAQVAEYTRKLMCCYTVGEIVFMAVEEQRKADAVSAAADEVPNPNGIVQLPLLTSGESEGAA